MPGERLAGLLGALLPVISGSRVELSEDESGASAAGRSARSRDAGAPQARPGGGADRCAGSELPARPVL